MQVNNSNNFAQLGINNVNKSTANTSVQSRDRVRSADDATQNSGAKKTTVERLAVSEQAITLFEQQSASNKQFVSRNTASLDQPSPQNLTAVNTYQTVNNLAQRESIQSMLGVDLYA